MYFLGTNHGPGRSEPAPDSIPWDKKGPTHRRGLETWELNLVNSPGAAHSVPSWEGRRSMRAAGHHTKTHQLPLTGINPKKIQGEILNLLVFGSFNQEGTKGLLWKPSQAWPGLGAS